MNIKEIIRAEIERLIDEYTDIAIDSHYGTVNANHVVADLEQLVSFIDTLPEQSVIKKSNALFDKCVKNCDPAVMKEVSDNIDKMLGKPPVEGLEEEIDRFENWMETYNQTDYPTSYTTRDIARHFAEWQKKQDQETIELAEDHAMLAGMNKMEQQMLEKAYDTIMQFDELDDLVPTFEDMQKFGFKEGDKVKVIILKEK